MICTLEHTRYSLVKAVWNCCVPFLLLGHFLRLLCKACAPFFPEKLFSVCVHLLLHTRDIHKCHCGVQPCQTTAGGHFSKNCTQVGCPFLFPLLVTHKVMFWSKRFGHILHIMLVRSRTGPSACFLLQWSIFCHILQCAHSVYWLKLVHIHNSTATEWIGSKLCC